MRPLPNKALQLTGHRALQSTSGTVWHRIPGASSLPASGPAAERRYVRWHGMSIHRSIWIDRELSALSDFLDASLIHAQRDAERIQLEYESGAHPGLDDRDNVFERPLRHQEIALRAVYYELTAMVEREVQQIAYNLPAASEFQPMLGDRPLTIGAPYGKLVRNIESRLGLRLSDLPGDVEVRQVREVVNAFKHRQGLKDFGALAGKALRIPDYYRIEVADAHQAIDATRTFLRSLWKALQVASAKPWPGG